MEIRKIVVVVEDKEAARTALQWALHNLLHHTDVLILLHVFQSTKSRNINTQRVLRLKGFQLALSFKDHCNMIPDAKVEIIVREGEQMGTTIASMVREIGASALVVGLHNQSFLYKMAMVQNSVRNEFNCRILAIKETMMMTPEEERFATLEFSQIEISRLSSVPLPMPQQKVPYQILPSPCGIIWRSRSKRKGRS
ncbi:hypothetical protein GIB67_038483 [Kingdonia uniflora]|uniref:UspA domain-containing protein n=1 Tax=Kingdonia uniflora TaxID=39325 RepID=A0A7J7LYV8_9MAGN|nr:hypothetical protein GIB67_021938 [Kingdonia uniflora]KAF6168986.1 hypothetical protein GIB67_038483 [Kingdonia uniflora]